MIMSISTAKIFDKIQHPFMIKKEKQANYAGEYFYSDEVVESEEEVEECADNGDFLEYQKRKLESLSQSSIYESVVTESIIEDHPYNDREDN